MNGESIHGDDPAEVVDVMDIDAGGEPFIIDGLVHESATVWYGRPEAGKSYYALSMIHAVTSGQSEWLGRRVNTHGKALFMPLDPGQQKQVRRRADLIPGIPSFGVSTRRPEPSNGHWWALARYVERAGIKLVVVDNLKSIISGSVRFDEQVGEALDRLDYLIDAGAAVVLIHHAGKPGEDGRPSSTPMGSTAIEAWARHLVRVDRKRERRADLHIVGNDGPPAKMTTLHRPSGDGKHGAFFDVLEDVEESGDGIEGAVIDLGAVRLARAVLESGETFTSLGGVARWAANSPDAVGGEGTEGKWKQALRRQCFGKKLLAGGSGQPVVAGPQMPKSA